LFPEKQNEVFTHF